MTETTKTPFITRCEILEEVWGRFREVDDFEDFISYNDLALPFAYGIVYGLIEPTEKTEAIIDEAFNLLLGGFSLEDTSFTNLEELLDKARETGQLGW